MVLMKVFVKVEHLVMRKIVNLAIPRVGLLVDSKGAKKVGGKDAELGECRVAL